MVGAMNRSMAAISDVIGDRVGAVRIAARFFDRSEATKTFKRGMDAHNNPGFYRQLGKDPDLLLSGCAGIAGAQVQFVTVILSSIPLRILSYRIYRMPPILVFAPLDQPIRTGTRQWTWI
jgi:hypothetical protein